MTEEERKVKRYRELADRARGRGIYTYTEFHSPSGAALSFKAAAKDEIKLWGGMEYVQRVVIRFGDESEIGYDEPFPIEILHIRPKAEKYADKLEHRDYLGAIMNLGIERNQVGDIVVRDKEAYVFVLEGISDYVIDNLSRIRHTDVLVERAEDFPDSLKVEISWEEISLNSIRLDALLAKAAHISRDKAKDLIVKENVLIDGIPKLKPEYEPKEDETIIVRGFGRFIYKGLQRENKKGKNVILIGKY